MQAVKVVHETCYCTQTMEFLFHSVLVLRNAFMPGKTEYK